jgi:hypothetical protein
VNVAAPRLTAGATGKVFEREVPEPRSDLVGHLIGGNVCLQLGTGPFDIGTQLGPFVEQHGYDPGPFGGIEMLVDGCVSGRSTACHGGRSSPGSGDWKPGLS